MKKKYDIVYNLLSDRKELRDDSSRLVVAFWWHEIDPFEGFSFNHFCKIYGTHRVTSSETICRLSRKVQEEHPHLRGELWEKRQGKKEKVIQDLFTLNTKTK